MAKSKKATSKTASQAALQDVEEQRERNHAAFLDEIAAMVWQPALRFASTIGGAPARCQRRVCQLDGQCHLSTGGSPPLSCDGGLSDETIALAGQMTTFACAAVENFVQQLVEALPAIAAGIEEFLVELGPEGFQEAVAALEAAASGEDGRKR